VGFRAHAVVMFTITPPWADDMEPDDQVYLIDRWPPARAWLIDQAPRFPEVWRVELHETGARSTAHQMFIVPRTEWEAWARKELADEQ